MRKKALNSFIILITLLILINSVYAQPADSPWPMFHGSVSHGGLSPYDTSHVDGTVLWTFQAGKSIESSPVIGKDGTIYFGSHDGFLYALNSDGTEKWKFDAGPAVYDKRWDVTKSIMATPAIAKDGTIYVYSSANYLFALNPEGKEKWRFKIKWDNDFWSSPVIGDDGTIYVGSGRAENLPGFKGGLFAINPDGKEKWFYDTGNGVTMPIAIGNDGTLYLGIGIPSQDKSNPDTGEIIALTPKGVKKWGFPVKLWVEGPATIGPDGTVYAPTKEGDLYALTPDGKEKWKFSTGDSLTDGLSAAPAIGSDGTIYLGAWNSYLYALTPDGKEKWKYKTPNAFEGITSPPAIGAEGTIYVGSNSGMFYAFNPDGNVKWEFDESRGSGITGGPAIAEDGTVYIVSQSGIVYALGCCSANKSVDGKCDYVEFEYDKRLTDPIVCPKTNVCLRWHKDGTECYEYGSCSEGFWCNLIVVNNDDMAGQFILKTPLEYLIYDIGAGHGRSIGWRSNEACENWKLIVPKKIACSNIEEKMNKKEYICGDGTCSENESSTKCPQDCGGSTPDCGDGICEDGGKNYKEDYNQTDKNISICGNSICELGEEAYCHDDCSKNFIKRIIDWFRDLFR